LKVGIFDSGLGGLTVVKAILDLIKGSELFYIADSTYAPYGDKSNDEILKRCFHITEYLEEKHQIDVLVVACNTATSVAIKELRQSFTNLIVIGTEPGIKPALALTKSGHIGVLATKATLKGDKYQDLVDKLSQDKNLKLYEQACIGLVEQIEKGLIYDETTKLMLEAWLNPMKENAVDTIVLGCTHYPLISHLIKDIMSEKINLIQTSNAIANRLKDLSIENGHKNEGNTSLKICHTGKINTKMIDIIFSDYKNSEKFELRKCEI
jgi:glutamate racemase